MTAAITSATVNALPASITQSTNFSVNVPLPSGTNILSVVTQDGNGNVSPKQFSTATSGSTPTALTYDANGNTLTDENGYAYTWDALNRMTKITYSSGATTNFAYDGLSRRVSIIEKDSTGTVTSTKNYLWIGQEIAEERDAINNVTKRFFPQGEQQSGTNYYYFRDHLGSVREMMDGSGNIVTRYSYDPYGRQTKVSGSLDSTFQYTGDYYHVATGLYLTKYRAYDSNTGRWLSRDPIRNAETYGGGLYSYCNNQSIVLLDPLGLQAESTTMKITITPDGFSAPDVTITAKSSCCHNIEFIQYTSTRFLYFFAFGTTSLDQNGDHGPGPFYTHYSLEDGSVGMTDKPGPDMGARIAALGLGGLVQEFMTCAICRDPGLHYNEILACVHWRVVNNGIATINASGEKASPPGKK